MTRFATAAVAVACGAVAGCLYLAGTLGTPGGLILVYLTQLPRFLAGLWLGVGAAVAAGLTGSAMFVAVNAAPVALLVRQALLARQREDGSLVWYPPGLLAAWLAALALAGIAAAVLLMGGPESLHAALRAVVGQVLERMVRRPLPNRDQVADALALAIPGMVAASWMIMAVVNGALAQGLLARFGINWRPSPAIAELGLPLWLPLALGLAALGTMLGGGWRAVAINLMIALSVPFCLAGLAVLHAAARRLTHPATALVGFYVIAAVFGWPFLAVAILGLLESWLGLRHRLAPQGARIDG